MLSSKYSLERCDEALAADLRSSLAGFERQTADTDGLRSAAVAMLICDVGMGANLPGLPNPLTWSSLPALMLTRRAASLRAHPGQWALPGGRMDEGESASQTALRELEEEVGVSLDPGRVLGLLDDFVTRSGYIMTPVVIWGGRGLDTTSNADEVASVHRIPLTEFVRDDAPWLTPASTSESPVLRMPVGDDHIAAPTAALIYQFRELCLLGRHTRVAHFEQPEFAWR